jgi:hypothetical protein
MCERPGIFIRHNPSSRQRECHIRTIIAGVHLKKECLLVGLKGLDAKTN